VTAFIIATASIAVGGHNRERKGRKRAGVQQRPARPYRRGHHLAAQAQDSVAMTALRALREVHTREMNPS
jgi:hypothetical protein